MPGRRPSPDGWATRLEDGMDKQDLDRLRKAGPFNALMADQIEGIQREFTNSGAWSWCGNCWRWHPWSRYPDVHYSLPPREAQTPIAANFDGTPEELRRFKVYRTLRKADAEAAIIAMELRIDAEL
jgi:hypothetical protein